MGSFPATEKLFDENAYAVEFEAKILSASRGEKKGALTWELILDRTLFFPEEGGQTPDKGEINGFPVIDVQLDGHVIRHLVSTRTSGRQDRSQDTRDSESDAGSVQNDVPFAPGQVIHGSIDFAHRFSNMQNHSGEHILSGLVHGRFGYDNVGFHLSDNTVTLDFNGPLTDEDILWLEQTANRVVWDNKEIRGWYPDPEELEKITYRSKKEIDGPLRLVEISGVDMCACCAPHVRRTGEIGFIKVIRTLRERGGIRLTILCGSRALAYMQTLQKAAEDVSHLTNMPREEIAAGTSRILEDNEKLRQREAQLESLVTDALARTVPADQQDVFLFADGIGNLAQRRLVNTLCETHPGYCGVFIGTDEDGYRYIIGAGPESKDGSKAKDGVKSKGGEKSKNSANSNDDGKSEKSKDARVLNTCLRNACGARGGGKPAMVQGSVQASEAEIRKALADAH